MVGKDYKTISEIDVTDLFVGKTLWRNNRRFLYVQDALVVPNHNLVLLVGYGKKDGRYYDSYFCMSKSQVEYINYYPRMMWNDALFELKND